MPDGCKHWPPTRPRGYDINSFTEGPQSAQRVCAVTSKCDSFHTFEVHNYHLYDVDADINASSIDQRVQVCSNGEDDVKQTQWVMGGKVPAAPYRPSRGVPLYGDRRFRVSVRVATDNDDTKDVIAVDYSIRAPAGRIAGVSFNVPVKLM